MKLGLIDQTGAELQTISKKEVILKYYTNLELSVISPGNHQSCGDFQ